MPLSILLLGCVLRVILVVMYLMIAYFFAPFDSPHLTPTGRFTVWLLVVVAVLGAVSLAAGFIYWFRKALLIYQITKLIHEKSGGRDTLNLVFRDGLPGYVSAYAGTVRLHIGENLDTFTYYIHAESTLAISRKRDLLLDDANSPAQDVLRWYVKDHVALEKVNERDVARWLREFIKEHK